MIKIVTCKEFGGVGNSTELFFILTSLMRSPEKQNHPCEGGSQNYENKNL